jgi:hypothetical protein
VRILEIFEKSVLREERFNVFLHRLFPG